jgi:Enoyl-(Acyl carrier protein) reductase
MELNGTSAVVTGGASGIGEGSARLLAARGVKVVIADLDRQAEKGEALAKELGGAFVPCDVTNVEQATAAMATAQEMAPLRSLVNAAGIGFASRTIDRAGVPHDLDWFKRVIDINLVGSFNCLRLAASVMNGNDGDAEHRISCGVRRTNWTSRVRVIKGWRCFAHIGCCTRSFRKWNSRELHCSRPHRYADLWHRRSIGCIQSEPWEECAVPESSWFVCRARFDGCGALVEQLHECRNDSR